METIAERISLSRMMQRRKALVRCERKARRAATALELAGAQVLAAIQRGEERAWRVAREALERDIAEALGRLR